MALKYLSNIDLGGLQIQNAKPYVITTADQTNFSDSSHAAYLGTGSANIGKMYWNSQTLTFLIWKGTGWVVLDGSGDISSVGLTADDGTTVTDNAGSVVFTVSGDTGISTTATATGVEIDLDDVTRTNTASTANVEYGGTIAPITSLTTNSQGQVTAATTTTITLPDLGTGSDEALPGNTDVLNVSNAHLLTALASLESSGGAANEEIVIGNDAGDTVQFTGSIQMQENSSFLATQFTFEDPTSGKPLVVLKNTNADTAGATLRFTKDGSSSAADNDEIGQIEFKHDDSGNVQHKYAAIQAFSLDVTNDDELGKLKLGVSTGHTTNSYQDGIVIEGHATDDRVDVTIGNGTDSVTTIAGDLTITGTTTTVNSTDVEIADINITVAKGATTSANANGSGITFSNWSSAPVLSWDHSNTRLNVNKAFHVAGSITTTGTVDGIDIATDVAANTLKETNVTTNLTVTADGDKLRVNSSDGNDVELPAATTSAWGVMSHEMFDVLYAAQTSAEVTASIDATSKVLQITGDGSDVDFDLTHDFDTRFVSVEILDYGNNGTGATYATVHADVTRPADDHVTVTFAVAPSTTQDYMVLLKKFTV